MGNKRQPDRQPGPEPDITQPPVEPDQEFSQNRRNQRMNQKGMAGATMFNIGVNGIIITDEDIQIRQCPQNTANQNCPAGSDNRPDDSRRHR